MFKVDDFWKIFELLFSGNQGDLEDIIAQTSLSEKSTTSDFFVNVVDQFPHFTEDYQRLRNFLIQWYASHKTVTTLQRNLSDVFSLTNRELDELFRSFGYDYSRILPFYNKSFKKNKADFFLDLVNLYKIKGTPTSLVRALNYYTLQEFDLIEYKLKKWSPINDFIFWGDVTLSTVKDFNTNQYIDLADFDWITSNDPHWVKTKQQILDLMKVRKIGIPSQSPYFSIRPFFRLRDIEIVTSYLARSIRDQYDSWKTTGELNKEIDNELIGSQVSLLETYLTTIYAFNNFNNIGRTPEQTFLCYDGTSSNYVEILDEYTSLTDSRITSRQEQKQRCEEFSSLFTRSAVNDILPEKFSCRDLLKEINPELLSAIDERLNENTLNYILTHSLISISDWLKTQLGIGVDDLAFFILGKAGILAELGDVINFFKPLHARFVESELLMLQKNRLTETCIAQDKDILIPIQYVWDYVTGDSHPCCEYPVLTCKDESHKLYYTRDLYNCGSYFDVGCCVDWAQPYEIYIEDTHKDTLCCRPNVEPEKLSDNYKIKDADNNDVTCTCGGFVGFDSGEVFDCTFGNDLAMVEII